MAALSRPTEATYTIHENVTVDTEDREDHTFCGIMFPVKAKDVLPVHKIIINQISVRGRLGPLTIWVTNNDEENAVRVSDARMQSGSPVASAASATSASSHRYNLRPTRAAASSFSSSTASATSSHRYDLRPRRAGPAVANRQISMRQKHWTKIYSRTHPPSFSDYTALDLSDRPIILRPGQVRGVYIHSTLPGDEAIVYDNKHQDLTHDDGFLSVLPGRAHVSETPFGHTPIWGWGNAWRDNREFVGRVSYGAVYRLWNPTEVLSFGDKFGDLTRTLFLCQRRWESPFSRLPDDCIFFVLNMCRWDWADDDVEGMRGRARERKRAARRRREVEEQEQERAAAAASASAAADVDEEDGEDTKMAAISSEDLAAAVSNSNEFMQDEEEEEEEESDGGMREEDDDSEEDDSDYDYEYDEYRNMNTSTFYYRDLDEEDDSEEEMRRADQQREEERRRSWIRSQFARIHVLRALASMSDEGVEEA